jgi:quinol monooxygenase YgiN
MNADATVARMSEVIGIARFKFHPGKLEEYKRLSAQAMDVVRAKEPGTIGYEIFLSDDETEAIVIERFRDEAALMEHGQNMAEISEQVLKTGEAHGELLGDLSDELRQNLVGGPVQPFRRIMTM